MDGGDRCDPGSGVRCWHDGVMVLKMGVVEERWQVRDRVMVTGLLGGLPCFFRGRARCQDYHLAVDHENDGGRMSSIDRIKKDKRL